MTAWKFTVWVEAETYDQAEDVMVERLNCDEDYGFEYTVGWALANDGGRVSV